MSQVIDNAEQFNLFSQPFNRDAGLLPAIAAFMVGFIFKQINGQGWKTAAEP
ncbi:hypothetical protein BR93DRAFT_931856 [Coniochaeta sp. PMI_546]|nr:hypothetical protein BR93DRAFT_931856 [Coniochaeta sp. PMI_546]